MTLTGDRKLPSADDLEEIVLGACLIEQEAIEICSNLLKAENFYSSKRREIFRCIVDMHKSEKPIDIFTLTNELKEKKILEQVGGVYYISTLTNNVNSAAHIEYHCRIIIQKYMQRQLVSLGNKCHEYGYDESKDVFESTSQIALKAETINNIQFSGEKAKRLSDAINAVISNMNKRIKDKSDIIGIPIGLKSVHSIIPGWTAPDVVVIAARPSVGKTAFALQMLKEAVKSGIPVAFFTLEMSMEQLTLRLISNESGVDSDKIRRGKINQIEYNAVIKASEDLKYLDSLVHIEVCSGLDISEYKIRCRKLKKDHSIQLIIVDYLQLMVCREVKRSGNREQEVSEISRGIKNTSVELNVPTIELCQINRSVDSRSDKRPKLSDLRESGSVEQDADIVGFLVRPEYYGKDYIEELERVEGITVEKGTTLICWAKHRNGAVGTSVVKFNEEIQRFEDIEMKNDNWTETTEILTDDPF